MMFADNTNPLAADLIKEFKSVSRGKGIKIHNPNSNQDSFQNEVTESPSKAVLSRIRSKESGNGIVDHESNIRKLGARDKYDRSKSDSKLITKPSSTLPRTSHISRPQLSRRLDHILALRAKSKPVSFPALKTLQQKRTKSVNNLIDYEPPKGEENVTPSLAASLDSWDSEEDVFDERISEEHSSYYEEPVSPRSHASAKISLSPVSQKGFDFQVGMSDSGTLDSVATTICKATQFLNLSLDEHY